MESKLTEKAREQDHFDNDASIANGTWGPFATSVTRPRTAAQSPVMMPSQSAGRGLMLEVA
jgi:hypothetical protein